MALTSVFVSGIAETKPLLDAVFDDSLVADRRPAVIDVDGLAVSGTILTGLTSHQIDRLVFYGQAAGGYATVPHPDTGAAMHAIVAAEGDTAPDNQVFEIALARDIMRSFANDRPDNVAKRDARALARAQSRVNAQYPGQSLPTFDGNVAVCRHTRAYSGFYALDEVRLRHETFSGDMTGPLDRAVLVTTDAALVLPYDPVHDTVLLVEQFRMGPYGRGDPQLWHLEPVAGLIDPGETPESTARREATEEAGLTIEHLEPIVTGYVSPGGSTDFQYLFLGICDLGGARETVGGLEAEGEDIKSHILPFEVLRDHADAGRLTVLPLVLMTHWLARHRSRLRSARGVATGI